MQTRERDLILDQDLGHGLEKGDITGPRVEERENEIENQNQSLLNQDEGRKY